MGNKISYHASPAPRKFVTSPKPHVARALCIDSVLAYNPLDGATMVSDVELNSFSFTTTPLKHTIHSHRAKPVNVESEVRRRTHLSALRYGFKQSTPIKPASLKSLAKPLKKHKVQQDAPEPSSSQQRNGADPSMSPPMPI